MKLHVSTMSCQHCVIVIDEALQEAGIKSQIDLSTKSVTVDDQDSDKAKTVIQDLGYTISK